MNKNKYALIIDGNYFLFRTLYVLPNSSKSSEVLGTAEDVEVYVRKLATDLAYQIRLFSDIVDTVVWTLDSKSWRKDFYPEAEYKGTRKSDSSINWDNFSTGADAFKQALAKNGVIISKVDGAEGDDLIYAWNTHYTASGKSTIILTGDRDMIQLVGKNESSMAQTFFYTPAHNKFYTYPGFGEWLTEKEPDHQDFFEAVKSYGIGDSFSKKVISGVISKKKLDVIEQDPEEFIFKKMLTGDKGDNVMPAYWKSSTLKTGATRTIGISDKKAHAIYESFIKKHGSFNYMFLFSEDYLVDIANILIREMNAKSMSREQIIANIKSNTNLMLLSSKTIPEEILDEVFKTIERSASHHPASVSKLSSMKDLLAGSQYADGNDSITSSFFNGEDVSSDMSFITDRKNKGKIF